MLKGKKNGKTGGIGGPKRRLLPILGPLSRQRNFYRDRVSLTLCRDRVSLALCHDRVLRSGA